MAGGRRFGSIITADEWAQIGTKTPSLFEEPNPDDDFGFAMPELSRMRYIERRPVASDVATRGSVSSQGSTKPERGRRMSQQVTDAFRKARDSIVGWTRTTVIEGIEPGFAAVSYEEEAIISSPEAVDHVPEEQHVLDESQEEVPMLFQSDIDEAGGMPLDTMHLCGAGPGDDWASITQREAERLLRLSLRAAVDRGEMNEDIIAARFQACNRKDKSEEAQWKASYDFEKHSAGRHELINATYYLGACVKQDVDSDVDLEQIPFTV